MAAGVALAPGLLLPRQARAGVRLAHVRKTPYGKGDSLTSLEDVTSWNNFYEFDPDKSDPAANAHSLKTTPWSVTVAGEVAKPGVYTLEERIYRHRCVEGWSMVIPWVGFPRADVIKRLGPTSRAKYVEFTTLLAPEQMPGQKTGLLDWPYNALQRVRRMLGLFAFFYGTLLLLTYVWLDQVFVWGDIVHGVMKRPFITVGFGAYLLLLPLVATSTNAMMKRLGRRWQTLHRLVYVIPALGVLHYLWLVKADINPPLMYGALLSVLLGVRLWWARRKRSAVAMERVGRVSRASEVGA